MPTKIEWCEETWNPITGCTPISEGCQNCYAKRMANRLRGRCGYPADEPFKVTLHKDRLEEPLRWKKPRRVFVGSMGDLFHEDVPDEFIYEIWDVMVQSKQHTFLVLTKRPDRMKSFIEKVMCNRMGYALTFGGTPEGKKARKWAQKPVQNVWLGVTAENQRRADERIPILLQIPAAVRFVSVEPMLGPVDLTQIDIGGNVWINSLTGDCKSYHPYGGMWKINESKNKLDWVICGGETGPGARPMHPEWARSLRDQCQAAGTPFFFKQWGKYISISQMPEDTYRAWDIHHGTEVGWEHDKPVWKVGKKFAGRLLDGREHNEYPEVTHERET
jgi:protein gp37